MLTPKDLQQIGSLITQSEERINKKFERLEEKLESKIEQTKEEILQGTADYIEDALILLLDKQDERLEHLEHHTAHPPRAKSTA